MTRVVQGDFLAAKAAESHRLRAARDPGEEAMLRLRCLAAPPPPSLIAALRTAERVSVIAEYKRRSPSAGALAIGEDLSVVAATYRSGGAAAISVLTDAAHFGGDLADLAIVAATGPATPVLRKDFITDAAQIYEARAAGAAAALLIAAMLDDRGLTELLDTGSAIGLECLVEVHTREEMERAAGAGASLVGINNRDLRRLTTDLAVTERLAPFAPAGALVISESGISSPDDVRRVRDAGAHGILVGEALLRLRSADRTALLGELAGVPR